MNEHIAKTHRAYIDLVEHLVPTADELNDSLPPCTTWPRLT